MFHEQKGRALTPCARTSLASRKKVICCSSASVSGAQSIDICNRTYADLLTAAQPTNQPTPQLT